MKRILIALVVLIVLLAVGGYFLFIKAITPGDLPTKVLNAEEAMAASGTIAIASIDMSYVRRIDKMLNPDKDPSPLSVSKSAESEKGKSLLEKLKQQGVNLISETDYALATINISEKKPAYSFVLFGRYSRDTLIKAFSQHYLVDEGADGYLLITDNTEQEKKDPCAAPSKNVVPKQQALHIQNNRILFSSPELMPILLKRFSANARSGVSLTNWRQFRKEKAVAGALISPKQANKGAVDLPSSLMLGALSKQPLQELYAGAVISLLPSPGFTFLIDAHSNETAWPLEIKSKYDAWLNEAVRDLKEMPTLASLIQTLNVQADGNILHIKTIANKNTLDNLEKIPDEFLKMAFSGAFGDGENAGATDVEQIVKDSEIEKYKQQFDFSSVQPFDEKNVFHKPDYVVGPLGVRIKKIGLLATDDSIIELGINVEGKGFENLSGELMHSSDKSPLASLSITSVEDKEGNNLLREELCGKTRNLVASSLNTMRDKEYKDNQWISKSIKVYGDKSVRLKQNVPLAAVAKIKGKIVVRAATRIRVQTLQKPFSGKTIETGKVRMYLRKSTPGTVKYTLSGDMSHIIAIRAKNAKGQYLAGAGSSSMGKETKMVSKRFKGKVASIEVVVAEEMQSNDYPFEITDIAPRYGKKENGKIVELVNISKSRFLRKHAKVKYIDECKDKQKVRVGAFLVCLNKFGERLGRETGGEFDVIAPYEEALQNDLSAVTLSIDKVATDSGEEIAFDKNKKVGFVYKFDTHYNDKKKEWQILNRRLNGAYVNIFSDNEALKNKKISMVKGTLTIRLPKRSTYFDLSADVLGVVEKSKNGIIATVSAFEDWSTYIDLQGPVDKVMRFMPIAKDGTVLNTDNDRITEKQYLTFGLSTEDKEKIKALPKMSQGMITIYGEPKVIRVFYANDFETIKHKFQFSIK